MRNSQKPRLPRTLVPSLRSRASRIKIVRVTWLDAYLCAEDTAEAGSVMTTVGALVRSSRASVKVAMTYDHTANGEGYRDVLTIPRGMVLNMTALETIARL